MVGRISVTTGQNEYRRISDVLSGDHKLAEDMKESRTEMFSFMSCAFFVAGENETFYTDSGNTVSVTGTSRRKFGAFKK